MIKKDEHSLIARVFTAIEDNNLFTRRDKLVVGISGGSDSTALLHILCRFTRPDRLYGVYVDHGLRPEEAVHEQEFVYAFCTTLGVHFETVRVDVVNFACSENRSTEEAARILRYRALEDVRSRERAQAIVVGHNSNDQVEEFFIRLIRGAGIRGLSGMQTQNNNIIRPLLNLSKSEIETYLEAEDIGWCVDSSNSDRSFLRNRIRLDLLPLLERDFTPAIGRTVLQTMDILRTDEDFLEESAQETYHHCVTTVPSAPDGLSLNLPRFLKQHQSTQRRVLEKCFWNLSIPPSYIQINGLIDFCQHGKTGGELHYADGTRAEKRGDELIFSRLTEMDQGGKRTNIPLPAPYRIEVGGAGIFPLPAIAKKIHLMEKGIEDHIALCQADLLLDAAKVTFPLVVRGPEPGERFYPPGGAGSKKIFRYLNEKKIARRQRSSWPVVYSGGRAVALAGLAVDHSHRITTATRRILVVQLSEL